MASGSMQLTASGNITACAFIKISGSDTAALAGSNDRTFGVSQRATGNLATAATAYAAATGQDVPYYGDGEVGWLTLGTGGATANDQLISDASGLGVTAASTGTTIQWVGAIALETGTAGSTIRVWVRNYAYRPALS